MAITDVPEFAHLTDADIENLAVELDAIRQDIEDSRGARDARYIRRTIAAQRALEVAGRLMLAASSQALGLVGRHRDAGRGQDHREHGDRPQRHARPVGLDERSRDPLLDVGVGHERRVQALAVHPQLHAPQVHQHPRHGRRRGLRRHPRHARRRWKPFNLGNLLFNTLLAIGFEWGVGLQHLELGKISKGRDDREATLVRVREFGVKAGHQVAKDYVAYPALTSLSPRRDLHVDADGQRGRQRHPQRLGQRGDLLRPLPRRRREVHQDRHGGRDARASGTCARCWAARTSRTARCCGS